MSDTSTTDHAPTRIVILPSGMVTFYYKGGISESWKPGQPGYEQAMQRARMFS